MRAGFAYERSPVQSADENQVNILDSDRYWLSTGLQYKINRMMTADLSYAHVFFKNSLVSNSVPQLLGAPINIIGETQRDADIFAVSLKLQLDPSPPPAPKIVK